MKRSIYLIALAMAAFCLTLVSCGKDDEPEKGKPVTASSVVGTWREDFSGGYQILVLSRNGSFTLTEIDYVSGDWTESGTYTVDGNKMIRTVIGNGYVDRMGFLIESLTTNTMRLLFCGGEGDNPIDWDNPSPYEKDHENWYRVN